MKKFAFIFILLLCIFEAFSQSEDRSPNDILQHGDWKSKMESDTIVAGSIHEVIEQCYEYNFFTTDRFAIFAFSELEDEDEEGLFHLYYNFRVYGIYEISDNQIKFHFEPEKTYCFLKDKLTSTEYERLMNAFIQDFIDDFNIIESIDNSRLILKNSQTGQVRSLTHSLPLVTK